MYDGADELFNLTLTGDGVRMEKQVTKQVANAIISIVLGGGALPQTASAGGYARPGADQAPMSPREYLNQSATKTSAEQITALGQFICSNEGKQGFTTKELQEIFRRAQAKIPSNMPRDIATATKAGWIHEDPGVRGQYYVTNTGMQMLDARASSNSARS